MWRKQRLQIQFLLEVHCCLFPPNTDIFYKMSFYGTKATENFQLNADVEVSLPTGTQVPGLPQSLLISWVLVQLMYFTVFRMLITVKTLPQTPV